MDMTALDFAIALRVSNRCQCKDDNARPRSCSGWAHVNLKLYRLGSLNVPFGGFLRVGFPRG
jgi:hypothetical protein